jgi:thiosulfate/3-mercaptopyruvate sulfurtransferase
MDSLVSTQWLAEVIGAPDLRVVDATYFPDLPGEPQREARAEYEAAHIPGAVFLDLANLADKANPLPAMVPSAEQFAAHVGALGIGDGDRIVFYDDAPHHTAARAWWLFRYFGIENVAILDGGLRKWRAEGRPLADGDEKPAARTPTVVPKAHRLRTLADMQANMVAQTEQVLDARSEARFTGAEPDPRPHTDAGHIPGSRNLRYSRLIAPDGTYKPKAELAAAFADAGIDLAQPVTMTCGSGITASSLAFAAHLLGTEAAVYDGSWSEWGADPATPKATGEA